MRGLLHNGTKKPAPALLPNQNGCALLSLFKADSNSQRREKLVTLRDSVDAGREAPTRGDIARLIGFVFGRLSAWALGAVALVLVGWFAGAVTVERCHAYGGAFCLRFELAVAKVRDIVDHLGGG
jgi:hypothetical protein